MQGWTQTWAGRPPGTACPIDRADAPVASEHIVHGAPSSRPASGRESGAPTMPSGAPRGTRSIERRATDTVCASAEPMTSSAEV